MKLRKYIILFIMIFILTGCTSTAKIKIDKNNRVNDNISFMDNTSTIDFGESSPKKYLSEMMDFYERLYLVNNHKSKLKYNSENVEVVYKNNKPQEVCEYFNNNYYINVIFDQMRCVDNNKYYELSAKSNYFYSEDEKKEIDGLKISMQIHNKVIDSNAISYIQNIYTWEFDFSNDNNEIYIKFYKNNVDNNSKILPITIIISLTLSIILLVTIFYYKHKKNKISY